MRGNYINGFVRKDINVKWIALFAVLASLSGGTIIVSKLKLGGDFRTDNIYAMYAFLSRLFVMFFPVILWGSEFVNRTINQLRISKRSMEVIYIVKFVTYMASSMILMLISYAEVYCYGLVADVTVGGVSLMNNMFVAYFMYGFFYYGLSSFVTIICRDTTKALATVFLIDFCGSIACSVLGQVGGRAQEILKYIPFSYAENAFSFANFTQSQLINIGIIGVCLNIIACGMLKKRGVV